MSDTSSRNLKSGPYPKSISPALPRGVGQSHWPPEAAAPSCSKVLPASNMGLFLWELLPDCIWLGRDSIRTSLVRPGQPKACVHLSQTPPPALWEKMLACPTHVEVSVRSQEILFQKSDHLFAGTRLIRSAHAFCSAQFFPKALLPKPPSTSWVQHRE